MEKNNSSERPEVYALRQEGGDWLISRRDFLKAAGLGAAALSAGMGSGCSRSKPLDDICREITTTQGPIKSLFTSQDGKYLLSLDIGKNLQQVEQNVLSCWDFENHGLIGKQTWRKESGAHEYNMRFAVACIEGKQIIAVREKENSNVYELPGRDSGEFEYIGFVSLPDSGNPESFLIDSGKNLYGANYDNVRLYGNAKGWDYETEELLLDEIPRDNRVAEIRLFDQERKLFIRFRNTINTIELEQGWGVLDLESRELKVFDGFCWDFAILSDQKRALICTRSKYRLVSLEDGTTIWEQDKPDPENQLSAINSAAVSPDGETGIILCELDSLYTIYLISLADGSRIRSFELGKRQGGARNFAGPVVNNAGTQVAVAVENNLFFFSLPDLRLIACPVDLDILWYKNKGIEVTGTDPVTGEEYRYTTVCGAAIPKGAVCTCNCVAGSSCACVGHKSSGGSSGSSHYWHPN